MPCLVEIKEKVNSYPSLETNHDNGNFCLAHTRKTGVSYCDYGASVCPSVSLSIHLSVCLSVSICQSGCRSHIVQWIFTKLGHSDPWVMGYLGWSWMQDQKSSRSHFGSSSKYFSHKQQWIFSKFGKRNSFVIAHEGRSGFTGQRSLNFEMFLPQKVLFFLETWSQ